MFGSVIVGVALLGLVAMPGPAMGQEKPDKKPKAAKSQEKHKKTEAKDSKSAKTEKVEKSGTEERTKLARLRSGLAEKLKLTPPQKERIGTLISARTKALAEAAKARDRFTAQHGDKYEELKGKIEAAKKAKNEALMNSLAEELTNLKELRAKDLEKHRVPKIGELFASIEKVLQPEQVETFKKLLVELKFVPSEQAGLKLGPKDFIKAIMSKSVGLTDDQRDAIRLIYKRKLAEIKTAGKDKAKAAEIRQALRAEIKAKLKDDQWQRALTAMAQLEKKIQKEARDKAAKAGKGKDKPTEAGKKPQADSKKKKDKGNKDKGKDKGE